MSKVKNFIHILLLGQSHVRAAHDPYPTVGKHWSYVKKIWNNESYYDFGIERIMRLSLALLLFVFPGIYVRHILGLVGPIGRKMGIEFYVVFKLLLPIFLLKFHLTNHLFIAIFSGVMAFETILYLASLIYLSDEYAKPIIYRRSITTFLINYIQVCFDYAVIYSYCNLNLSNFFKQQLTSNIQSVYFSFVTSTTVGYGDITVNHPIGRLLVVTQVIVFLVFIALYLNFFVSKAPGAAIHNSKN
ncbi:MAG TPA: potassium channel family protein [Chitinophagales bacterium]|nr:potassium channel family protein [Chitinophagales bacterium]HNM31642.1 potassium channel family protein [Chitinophagales bacterium]